MSAPAERLWVHMNEDTGKPYPFPPRAERFDYGTEYALLSAWRPPTEEPEHNQRCEIAIGTGDERTVVRGVYVQMEHQWYTASLGRIPIDGSSSLVPVAWAPSIVRQFPEHMLPKGDGDGHQG